MPQLTTYNISDIAAELDEPFSMANVAYVDDLLVSVYICEGELQWHKHVDIDELFWVHDGGITLESERGAVPLERGELTVVPKGIRHRSRSSGRAVVVLLRCGLLPNRKNGKRRLYAAGESDLSRINPREVGRSLPEPFRFQTIAEVEDARVQVARGSGRWPIELPVAHDRLMFVLEGSLRLRTVRGSVRLSTREFTVVPRGAFYHLHTDEDTLLVRVTREAL